MTRIAMTILCLAGPLAAGAAFAADKAAPSMIIPPAKPAAPRMGAPSPARSAPERGVTGGSGRARRSSRSPLSERSDDVRFSQSKFDFSPQQQKGEKRVLKDMVGEPWLSPSGERLVAVVDDRQMTKSELDLRVNIVLKNAPLPDRRDPDARQKMEDRRYEIAQTVLGEWVVNTTLALEAIRSGLSVTDKEVDAALAKLSAEAEADMKKVASSVKLVGVPQEQLAQEVRDGLLVEKFIQKTIREYDKSVFEKLYEGNPGQFLIPPRARVFHIYRALDNSMSAKDQRKIRSELEKMAKSLKKAQTPADYEALSTLSDQDANLAVGDMGWISADMGWVSSDSQLQSAMINKVFRTPIGQTSDVFAVGLGLHVIKVLEREEGSEATLEAAMPQIETYLFGKTKEGAYAVLSPRYDIQINSGGLSRWREATAADMAAAAQPAAPKPVAAPPQPLKRGPEPPLKIEPKGPEVDLDLFAPAPAR